MAEQAYTPGLIVSDGLVLRKERRLPLDGDVVAHVGDEVEADTVVARTELPGQVHLVNVAGALSVPEGDVESHLTIALGETVESGEIVAETRGIFGMFRSRCRAPATGSIESISSVTGQAVFREPPTPLELTAYVGGKIVETTPGEGVVVETKAALAQGIFGIGGETVGTLALAVDAPDQVATPDDVLEEHAGCILVAGSRIDVALVDRARSVGVKALVGGGIDDAELRSLLGYDIGVAITGAEQIGMTIVITEGFGELAIATRTFELLATHAGAATSVNGATQIRAGVLRPEIVIPLPAHRRETMPDESTLALAPGSPVRAIRGPRFGQIGMVASLPAGLVLVETEAHVRAIEVDFTDGSRETMPRANVEIVAGSRTT